MSSTGSSASRLEVAILLEEIVARNIRFELTGTPRRLRSNLFNGIQSMPVRVTRRSWPHRRAGDE